MEHSDKEYSVFLLGVGRFRSRWAAVAWLRKYKPESWANLDYEICEVSEYPESGITPRIEEGVEIGDREWTSGPASWERFKERYSRKGYNLEPS